MKRTKIHSSNSNPSISRFMIWFLALGIWIFPITQANADEAAVAEGRQVFVAQCARCHGMEGKGDGPDAKRLWIVPRDFTSGRFKFKSTVQGTPPSDADLINGVIGHGLGGSGMPSFGNLDAKVRANLVAYIKTISPAFQNAQAPQPIPDPSNRRAKPDLEKGKEVFTKMQCASCHGANGRANGTSAFTLVDAWQRPIKAANLTQGWTYRGGSDPIDIYHRILAGIDGAPMPSYEGAASHEDIWNLCNYVASLQRKTNWSTSLNAPVINGTLPSKADDPAWKDAKAIDLNMQDYVYENGHRVRLTVNAVTVQAVANDNSVAFKVSWDDPVQDSDKSPADSILVAVKPADFAGDPRANLHTLYENDSAPLDVMLWQASKPQTMGQRTSTLANASRPGWAPNQILESSAVYEDGRWTMVFKRPLTLDGGETFKVGEPRFIGFVAWDGHNGETGIKHTSSQWVRLTLGNHAGHH